MPIKVTCSNCGGVLHAPDDAGGKKGRCPTCGNVLPIPAEGPRVAAAVPDAPRPAARSQSQSFGEFAHGAPADGHAATPARSSVPSVTEKRRASAALPPPSVAAANNRGSYGTAVDPEGDGAARRWRRVGRGLWWVRAGVFFLLLPVVLVNGLKIYEALAKPLPVQDPGYAKIAWLSSTQEIELAAIGVPLVLGLPMLVMGRLGASNAPQRSRSRGLAGFAALATLLALVGGIVFLMPAVAMVATEDAGKAPPFLEKLQNQPPKWQMFSTADNEGLMQRGGILLAFFGLALAEFWFLAAVGRMGTALESPRFAARATRMTVLYGLLLAVGFALAVGNLRSNPPTNANDFVSLTGDVTKYAETQWNNHGQPQYDKLAEHKATARGGVYAALALFVGLGYCRMAGAGRRAVRDWLEANERP